MNDFLKKTKLNFVLMAIIYILFGLMFLIRPDITNKIIVIILGLIITLYGIFKIITHVQSDISQRFQSFNLGIGIIALLVGLFFLIKPGTIVSIFGAILGL